VYGDVKEMRESVYGRRTGSFGALEKPAREERHGDSGGERMKRVEVKGADKAERVTQRVFKAKERPGAAAT